LLDDCVKKLYNTYKAMKRLAAEGNLYRAGDATCQSLRAEPRFAVRLYRARFVLPLPIGRGFLYGMEVFS